MNPDLTAKRVEFLKQAIPQLTWVGAVHRGAADFPVMAHWIKENEEAGRRLGVRVQSISIAAEAENWEQDFVAIPKRPGIGLTVLEDPQLVANSARIAALLVKHRLPAVFPFREHAEAGGLLSYGVSVARLFRRAAHFIDRIVGGAKPANLPIEQPTNFDFVVNKRTATALGLAIPASVFARADHVIE